MARKKKRVTLPEANVNITPLLDVMTVLLFFLIKSMSVNSTSLDPPKGVRLPASTIEVTPEEAVKVALSDTTLWVDDKPLVSLQGKKFAPKDIGEDKRTIVPLKEYLQGNLKKKYKFFKDVGDISKLPPNKITIQADKELPFGLMKYMLHTVTVAGYSDFQFVVIPPGE